MHDSGLHFYDPRNSGVKQITFFQVSDFRSRESSQSVREPWLPISKRFQMDFAIESDQGLPSYDAGCQSSDQDLGSKYRRFKRKNHEENACSCGDRHRPHPEGNQGAASTCNYGDRHIFCQQNPVPTNSQSQHLFHYSDSSCRPKVRNDIQGIFKYLQILP